MIRVIATWHAGRLIQLQWCYRLVEDDGLYRLDCRLDWQDDSHYAPAFGHAHREAQKIAAGMIERDREWLDAEAEAWEMSKDMEKVLTMPLAKRANG